MTTERRKLILETSDINQSDTLATYTGGYFGSTGFVNFNRTSFGWYNINLKTLLGNDLWDKYENFNLKLCSVGYNVLTTYGTTLNDRTVIINMSGLNWQGSYNVKTQTNNSVLPLIPFSFLINNTNIFFIPDVVATFKKQELVNINIFYLTNNGTVPASTNLFPQMTFYFDIIPCDPV